MVVSPPPSNPLYDFLDTDSYLLLHNILHPHLHTLKRIIRYVLDTLDHGLQLHVSLHLIWLLILTLMGWVSGVSQIHF